MQWVNYLHRSTRVDPEVQARSVRAYEEAQARHQTMWSALAARASESAGENAGSQRGQELATRWMDLWDAVSEGRRGRSGCFAKGVGRRGHSPPGRSRGSHRRRPGVAAPAILQRRSLGGIGKTEAGASPGKLFSNRRALRSHGIATPKLRWSKVPRAQEHRLWRCAGPR